MKPFLKIVSSTVVWLVSSMALAHFWVTNPEVFPPLPSTFWGWLDSYYGSRNAEEVSDLEFIVTFSVSAVSILILFFLTYVIWRKYRSVR